MNKRQQLFQEIADTTQLTKKQVEAVFVVYADFLTADLKTDGELLLPNLGTFRRMNSEKQPGKSTVKFIPNKALRETLIQQA